MEPPGIEPATFVTFQCIGWHPTNQVILARAVCFAFIVAALLQSRYSINILKWNQWVNEWFIKRETLVKDHFGSISESGHDHTQRLVLRFSNARYSDFLLLLLDHKNHLRFPGLSLEIHIWWGWIRFTELIFIFKQAFQEFIKLSIFRKHKLIYLSHFENITINS